MYMKFVYKIVSFRKYFGTGLSEEIRTSKLCTEVFVMPKHLIAKIVVPESSFHMYMSLLHVIVCFSTIFQNYCEIVKNSFFFAPSGKKRGCFKEHDIHSIQY